MGRPTTQMVNTARARRSAIATASLSIAILAMAVLVGAAQAATQTFSFTGTEQTFTVPAGVTSVQVGATGASGAAGDPAADVAGDGGLGAHVGATLAVTPGQTLFVEVGGVGECNGAGPGGNETVRGGSGGGAADVRTVSVAGALCGEQGQASLQSRLIAAAGGGGGGAAYNPGRRSEAGPGGDAGQAAPNVDPVGGGLPGTQSEGGAAFFGATAGSLGQGGAGAAYTSSSLSLNASGGGGGGGLYGGGGGQAFRNFNQGAFGAGGGGGSSLVPAGGLLAAASGPAQVTMSYTVDVVDPSVTITTPVDGAIYAHGESVIADYACADEAGGSGVGSCAGPVADGAPVATGTLGEHTFSVTATDRAGNDTTKSVSYTVTDQTDPTVTITSPVDGAQVARGTSLPADYACGDEAGGSGLASCEGMADDGQPVDTSVVGDHAFAVTARDVAGNETTETVHYTVLDVTAPTMAIASPTDGQAIGRNTVVAAQYVCVDEAGGSGVATCSGTVAGGQPLDTSTLGPKTFSVTATDHAGNTDTKTVAYTVVDVTAPTINAATPGADTVYEQGATILADYSCADEPGGSGLASCTGTVPSGQPIDTSDASHTFTINAADNAGNTASRTIDYTGRRSGRAADLNQQPDGLLRPPARAPQPAAGAVLLHRQRGR